MSMSYPPLSPTSTGLTGHCPRCGQGKLFDGFLTLRKECEVCHLDYSFADSADGPAVFVMFLVGFVVVGLALWVEFTWEPPFWVHALLWIPAIIVLCFGLLRPLKGLMVALQFHHKAQEGRLER